VPSGGDGSGGADPDPQRAARTGSPGREQPGGGTASTRQFYSRWARLYDAVADRSVVSRVRAEAVTALAPAPGDVVVDVGCGTGANVPHLRRRVRPGGAVVGLDFTPGMLAAARRRARRDGWDDVQLLRADATRPPVREADAAFAAFVSGMLADPAAAVRSWAAVVGPGGRLGLLDLARSTGSGRPLNPAFRAFVRATTPPGGRSVRRSPASLLDERVAAAHRALADVCTDVTHETYALGFARVTAGTVTGPTGDRAD
jgi:ubiquinone/menaquinone biosynthesis C-methylase UbiE